MKVFLDTSAFFAILDRDDINHPAAGKQWNSLASSEENTLITSNYVLIESYALIQHRLGIGAARSFHDNMLGIINIYWVGADVHKTSTSAFLAASRRKLSLVDCISFEVMRVLGIRSAFVFDPHFREQGFTCIP